MLQHVEACVQSMLCVLRGLLGRGGARQERSRCLTRHGPSLAADFAVITMSAYDVLLTGTLNTQPGSGSGAVSPAAARRQLGRVVSAALALFAYFWARQRIAGRILLKISRCAWMQGMPAQSRACRLQACTQNRACLCLPLPQQWLPRHAEFVSPPLTHIRSCCWLLQAC
jgi:hypothetical protein